MTSDRRFWSLAMLCSTFAACGRQHTATHPAVEAPTSPVVPAQQAAPAPTVLSEPKATDAVQAPPTAPAPSAQEKPSPTPGIAEICDKLTRRANERCGKKVAGFYQSSCNFHMQKPDACESQLRVALECQYKAADEVFCAHGADHRCSEVNRELKTCQRGTAPAEQTTAEDDHTIPTGWESIQDSVLGFTVAMPKGAALNRERKNRTWNVEDGGISYEVAAIDAPSGKLDNQTIVRTVIGYVGNRCQQGLKLHGQLELKGTTVVQYHSNCPDKTEWHGMLHFWNGKAVSTGYHAKAGETGVREPYFYSFVPDVHPQVHGASNTHD